MAKKIFNKRLFITNWKQPLEFWHKEDEVNYDLLRFDQKSFFSKLKNILYLKKQIHKYDLIVVKGFVIEVFILLIFFSCDAKLVLVEMGLANKAKSILKLNILTKYLNFFSLIHTWTPKLTEYIKSLSPKSEVYWDLLSNEYDDSKIPTYNLIKNGETLFTKKKIISAGRTFRDYEYLVNELTNENIKIIGDTDINSSTNSNLEVIEKLNYNEFIAEIKNAKILIIPLTESEFSVGMRVIQLGMKYAIPIFFTRHQDNEVYFAGHEFYDQITFLNDPGILKRKFDSFNKIYNDELIKYNYEFACKKFSSKKFLQTFNKKIST
jgi:hypothetical protein